MAAPGDRYSRVRGAGDDAKGDLARLELVMDSAQLGIWDWYVQTGEVVFNKRWKQMLGGSRPVGARLDGLCGNLRWPCACCRVLQSSVSGT